MDRREMLGMMGAGALGLTATAARAADESDDHCCDLDKTHEECLKACIECAKACNMAFHHCYTKITSGKNDHAVPLHFVSDCAGFCTLSAAMIAKRSALMVHSCASCAEACKATANEVEKFESEEMKHAAKKLQECERSCRAMVTAMRGPGVKAN